MCRLNKSSCNHLPDCIRRFQRISSLVDDNSQIYKKIAECMLEFCYSGKNSECARYALLEKNLPASNDLLPNGTRIKFREFLPITHYKMR